MTTQTLQDIYDEFLIVERSKLSNEELYWKGVHNIAFVGERNNTSSSCQKENEWENAVRVIEDN